MIAPPELLTKLAEPWATLYSHSKGLETVVTFLHIVHKAYSGKQYIFWGMLIDKATLAPIRMTARPLFRAGPSGSASHFLLD